MKRRFIPVNLYWVVLILALIGLFSKKDEKMVSYLGAAGSVFLIQLIFGKTKAYNLSGKTIYRKNEDGKEAYIVPPYTIVDELDGVGLPESKKVIKVKVSTTIICLPKGHYIYGDPISGLINLTGGGKKSNTTPNDSWKPLFEAAAEEK